MKQMKVEKAIPKFIGFEPVFDNNSKVLILGSFPSVISRKNEFYYGNKQNRFWKMLSRFFNVEIKDDKKSKIKFLKANKIALWDVAKTCSMIGSSDSKITTKNIEKVDLYSLLDNAKNIDYILINGKKAYILFNKFFPNCKIKAICMPSTSPANVRYDETIWIKNLQKIFCN